MSRIRFQSIVPKRKDRSSGFKKDLADVVRRNSVRAKRGLERPTKTWTRKVQARRRQSTRGQEIFFEAYVEDDVYTLVNDGAPPHDIAPINYGYLRIADYTAKTTPGSLSARSGGRHARNRRVFRPVRHPGFPARDFESAVEEEVGPQFEAELEEALAKFVAESTS